MLQNGKTTCGTNWRRLATGPQERRPGWRPAAPIDNRRADDTGTGYETPKLSCEQAHLSLVHVMPKAENHHTRHSCHDEFLVDSARQGSHTVIRGQATKLRNYPVSRLICRSSTAALAFGPRFCGRRRRFRSASSRLTNSSPAAGRPVRVASRIRSQSAASAIPLPSASRHAPDVQRRSHAATSSAPQRSIPPVCAAALDHGQSAASLTRPARTGLHSTYRKASH